MDKILEIKGYIVRIYGKFSKYFNKGFQFLLALLTFTFINKNIGFSSIASNPVTTIALSLICTFLPMSATIILATILSIVHLFTMSLGITIVVCALFFCIYAVYLRFTPEKAVVLLLVPVAYMFQIPMVVPIAFGLLGSPVYILPIAMGTLIYYMIHYVQSYGTMLGTLAEAGMVEQMTTYLQQVLASREMWCTIIAFSLCLLIVYCIRRTSVDHAWEIAIVAGALLYLISMALGYVMMDIPLNYVSNIIASVVSVLIAFVLEIFVFSVDYTRTEYLQFEDDEYYYYVKAVPKAYVAVPEKTVKRINERQETEMESEEDIEETESVSEIDEEKRKKEENEESEIQKIIEEELKN